MSLRFLQFPQPISMPSASSQSVDFPRLIMWTTLLIGLVGAGYELFQGSIELTLAFVMAGLVGWAALRVLLQIRESRE
jgi:hypothetical protein